MTTTSAAITPRIYVGTYAKYNDGSIFGKWFDLSDYSCKEDFLADCAELHKDEADPEFMFQDWEDIPDTFISESSIGEDFWEWWDDIEDLCIEEQEAYKYYSDNLPKGEAADFKRFKDEYHGCFDSEREFADNLAEEQGFFEAMEKAGISPSYFDTDAYANDLFQGEFWMSDKGHVFTR